VLKVSVSRRGDVYTEHGTGMNVEKRKKRSYVGTLKLKPHKLCHFFTRHNTHNAGPLLTFV
jgi:hypothetical protein